MSFEPASQFIFTAAKKYNLHKQASSGIVLQRVSKVIETTYSDFYSSWKPQKFENGKLTIETLNATASSVLFMHTHELIEKINQHDLPQKVREITIRKKQA